MSIIVIGAAQSGSAESITREILNRGFSVIGTYDKEYSENAKKMQSDFSDKQLRLYEIELSDREKLYEFVNSVDEPIEGFVFAQYYFEMENPFNFDHNIWDKSIAINLTAPNFLIHELKNKMQRGCSIVIITSTEGFRGSYGASAYASTKAAIHNLIKTLANNLGKLGVRINAIPAGYLGGEDTGVFGMSKKFTPLERLGKDEELAKVVLFLLSSESSFVNGTTIISDGGYLCSDPLSQYEFDSINK